MSDFNAPYKGKWCAEIMDECKDCEKAPSHVSRCVSPTGYCKYFPYEMPDCYGQRVDMKEEKHERT